MGAIVYSHLRFATLDLVFLKLEPPLVSDVGLTNT
jgi:hypothetical protein